MVVFLFLIGACLGSFYLVVGKRLPKGENVINDRSRCDLCHHKLAWYDLIPIFSYVFLKGKCRYCHKKIDYLNLVMEIATGSLFVFGYYYFGLGYNMYIFLIVISLLLVIYISDFSYYIILDSPLVIASILVIGLDFYYYDLSFVAFRLISGVGLFGVMFLVGKLGNLLFKKESLGGGDIKLAFVMGLILGFRLGLVSLILSAFLALPYSYAFLMIKKNNEVPYGPFLAASLLVVSMFAEKFSTLLDAIFYAL